ncbi:globin family protein [Dongia sedimenti]|uniref:Globin family protein n=1 Tax=Dongia sedimenti TaxID=3064282 RepID=A0ABU0YJI0_9PROT|nr:globin family protein [Rhodospirillaceae bacterium R-7]
MTPRQIEIVKLSFGKIMPFKDQAAELFYCRLFELDPSLRLMFKSDMTEQKQKLMVALALVVTNLEKMDSLLPAIRELGRRHKSYGVRNRHYDVVGAALLWTLEIGLGTGWNKELADAWSNAYGRVAAAMIEGAESPEPARRPARQAAE